MNGIIIRETENFDKALRRFIRTCERSGVLSELKKYKHYEKPSEQKKRKLNSAKQRAKMKERDEGKKRGWN
jgi:small subunit ribosomal protein S21